MPPNKKDPKSPATTSMAYDSMLPIWTKVGTLLAGTEAMRAAGEEYLPKHQEESDGAYRERLSTSLLLNMLQMTLDSWVSRPFAECVKVNDDVPEQLSSLLDDVDLQGNDINVFARHWFRDGTAKGFSHVLVEYPRPQPAADGQARTLADDRAEKLRPYCVQIPPENLIFASSEIVEGVERVTHVRIREESVRISGFAEVVDITIREIEPGKVTIWEQVPDKRTKKPVWKVRESYDYDLDFIPLVTFYADRQGLMQAKPPLADLADLNVAHWQSRSDQTNILKVTRFPILAASGVVDTDNLVIGPNHWLGSPDPSGRFYYVEHSGRAIAAGRQDLLDLQELMAEYGATFLKKRPGGATATARALDTAEITSPLQDMAIRFQSSLDQMLAYMGAWEKLPPEQCGTLEIKTDIGLSRDESDELVALQGARTLRDISRKSYLTELQRYKVLSDDFSIDQNEADLENEMGKILAMNASELDPAGGNPAPTPKSIPGGKKPAATPPGG